MAIVKFNSEEGFSVGYNPIDVIDANGNVVANVLNVTTSAALGSIGSITILGGSNGQAIVTDGLGNLSFETISGGGGTPQGPFGALQYNNFGVLDGDANLYYNPTLNILYAPVYSGDAALLSNIPGPNVVGTVPNANFATYSDLATVSTLSFYVSEANQPNITSVGSLTDLSVVGNANIGQLNSGNVTAANYFIGNGAYINYVEGNAVVGAVANANYALFSLNTLNSNDANAAINVIGSSQPNITAVGSLGNLVVIGNANVDFVEANGMISNSSLLVKGDTTMLGNLIVYGNTIYADVTRLTVKDPIIEMGGNPNGDPLSANDTFDRGSLMHYYTTLPVDAFMGWVSANAEFAVASNVSMVNNSITIHELGNLRANVFIGNGAALANITAANIDGEVSNATFSTNANFAYYAGNITENAQPNITSVGTLIDLSVTGNVNSGNANLGDLVYGNFFIGDGSNLSNINGGNVTGTVANASYAVSTDTANTAATVTTASQPNITSVGTLTTLTVSGNVDAINANLGDIVTANYYVGNGYNLSDVAGANVSGIVANANYALYADNILTASQPNITSVGTLTSLSVSGNITAANANLGALVIANYFSGNAYNLFDYLGANIVGEVANANYATFAGNASNAVTAVTALTAATITANAQPNITSVGTLTLLSVTGNITSGNADLGNTVVANYFVGNGNALANIYGPNVTGIVANANFAANSELANTANSAVIAGTVTTNAQPNITSVGVLSSLSVTGNANIGNLNSTANGSFVGNVTASTFIGNFTGTILSNIPAPGNNYEIIFNNSGNTGASNAFTFNNSTNVATLSGNLSVTTNITRGGKTVPTYAVQSGAPSNPEAGDGWYDTDNDRTYTYTYDGVSYQWVDVTSGYLNANTAAVGNTLALRDINGNVNANVFNGNNAVLTNLTVNTSLIGNVATFANAVYANGNVTQPNQLATKEYVDQQTAAGLHIHDPVIVRTTGNLIASYNNGGTALTITTITSNTTFTTSANHGLSVDDVIVPSTTSNGLTSGVAYFVYSTPALNQFTLSTTFHGPQTNTFTNGTSLTIGATGNPGLGATLTNAGTQAPLSIDTINLTLGQRVLVVAQTNAYENGVYEVTTVGTISTNWVLTRAYDGEKYHPTDINGLGEGDYFYVESGTTGAGDSYVLTTPGVIIIGTTNLTFTLFSAAITYTGVSPVVITGQQISLANLTGTGDVVVLANTPTLITPNIGAATGTSLSLTGNLTSANANLGNAATANFFIGSGNNLSNIQATSITGTVANANYAAYAGDVVNANQSNITNVGTLTSVSVTGNSNLANINANVISITGNLTSANANLGNAATANFFIGNGYYLTGLTLGNSLQDVNANSPNAGQYLVYNGTQWTPVNAGTTSAGQGVSFWLTTPIINSVGANTDIEVLTLSGSPNTSAQTYASVTVNGTQALAGFISAPLNRTVWDAGNWDFSIWANISSIAGTNTINCGIHQVLPNAGTVTTTGTGTSRTVTASTGTPFATVVPGSDVILSSYVQTPQGLYRVTAKTSDTVVTINVPTTYTNETTVIASVWIPLFNVGSAAFATTALFEYNFNTTQPPWYVTTNSAMGLLIAATTATSKTVSVTINGTSQSSHFTTPLSTLHNSLAGLQGGTANEYYHLTNAEYTGTGSGSFVRSTSPVLTTPNIGAAIGTSLSVTGNISAGNIIPNVVIANSVGSKDFKSLRSNIAVTANTVVDEFAVATYRTAKYIVQAQGDIGFQSVEVLMVHDNTDSYITIFASVYSNAEVITISSNVVTGNAKLYATASGANTTVNLLSMYVLD
jgi:hypothetical protein